MMWKSSEFPVFVNNIVITRKTVNIKTDYHKVT